MRRLISAVLLLYPRSVRRRHGAELASLVEELIRHEGRSRPRVMSRLVLDGVIQRLTARATAWAVALGLALMTFGGLAASDFAAASAQQSRAHRAGVAQAAGPRLDTRAVTSTRRDRRVPEPTLRRRRQAQSTARRSAGIIDP